jgi:hypothetical protein
MNEASCFGEERIETLETRRQRLPHHDPPAWQGMYLYASIVLADHGGDVQSQGNVAPPCAISSYTLHGYQGPD